MTKHKNVYLCSDKLLVSYTKGAHRNMLIVTWCEHCCMMFAITVMCWQNFAKLSTFRFHENLNRIWACVCVCVCVCVWIDGCDESNWCTFATLSFEYSCKINFTLNIPLFECFPQSLSIMSVLIFLLNITVKGTVHSAFLYFSVFLS